MRGGRRAGAGRKPSARKSVLVSWRISEASREWIKEIASASCITPGEVVDELIARLLHKSK